MSTFAVEASLKTIECGCCGGVYAISKRFYEKCRENGESWKCPYPDCNVGWGFAGNGEKDRLKKELERTRQRLTNEQRRAESWMNRAEHEERRAAAYKGHFTRVKKRVGKGVCPCCNRTFKNLQRHMETKHPDYSEAAE